MSNLLLFWLIQNAKPVVVGKLLADAKLLVDGKLSADAKLLADGKLLADAKLLVDGTLLADAKLLVDGTLLADAKLLVDGKLLASFKILTDLTYLPDLHNWQKICFPTSAALIRLDPFMIYELPRTYNTLIVWFRKLKTSLYLECLCPLRAPTKCIMNVSSRSVSTFSLR